MSRYNEAVQEANRKRQRQACLTLLLCLIVLVATGGVVLYVTDFSLDDNDTSLTIQSPPTSSPLGVSSPGPSQGTPEEVCGEVVDDPGTCNGLASLCNVPVNEVLFATMHNANSDASVSPFSPNHNLDMRCGLQGGIRGLNLDWGYCQDQLSLVHGVCVAGFSDPVEALQPVQQFLSDHPRQVLILPSEINDATGQTVLLEDIAATLDRVVDADGNPMSARLYSHPPNATWPTLGELVDSDKRILFFHHSGSQSCRDEGFTCPPGFHDWFAFAAETQFSLDSAEAVQSDPVTACTITRGGTGTRDFFGINLFAKIPSEDESAIFNERGFLQSHMLACANQNNLRPNLLIVDFWSIGDVKQVVEFYNSQL